MRRSHTIVMAILFLLGGAASTVGQSSSVLLQKPASNASASSASDEIIDPAESLHAYSLFTVAPPKPRTYQVHDLVDIIIRESSSVRSKQSLETEKSLEIDAEIRDFPQFTLNDILDGVLKASENANPPAADIDGEKSFEGDGQIQRNDDFSARVKAQVIEVLPNGNLVVEARTRLIVDSEESTILLSGVCDPKDITPAGSLLSSQLFDLQVIKLHEGELKKATQKGVVSRVLEGIFAF
ncbi:MAG: flagellar basal body L-ring protein FlgH [Phycisphaerales bacterium]